MKVIICGSRNITAGVWDAIDAANFPEPITEIVVGDARGVDAAARRWAEYHGIPCKVYYADWDRHGKRAGIVRNNQMLWEPGVTGCLAVWDGLSSGTKHMWEAASYTPNTTVIVEINGVGRQEDICPF